MPLFFLCSSLLVVTEFVWEQPVVVNQVWANASMFTNTTLHKSIHNILLLLINSTTSYIG